MRGKDGGMEGRKKKGGGEEGQAIPLSTTDRFWRCLRRAGPRVPPRGAVRPRPGPRCAVRRDGSWRERPFLDPSHFASRIQLREENTDTSPHSGRRGVFILPLAVPFPLSVTDPCSDADAPAALEAGLTKNTNNPKPEKQIQSCSAHC